MYCEQVAYAGSTFTDALNQKLVYVEILFSRCLNPLDFLYVKFRYFEKSSKFGKMSHFLKNYSVTSKQGGRFFQIFVTFSEYLSFTTWFVFLKGGFLTEDIMVSSKLHSMVPNHGLRFFFVRLKSWWTVIWHQRLEMWHPP